jgi:hypothetical protein
MTLNGLIGESVFPHFFFELIPVVFKGNYDGGRSASQVVGKVFGGW